MKYYKSKSEFVQGKAWVVNINVQDENVTNVQANQNKLLISTSKKMKVMKTK